MPDYEPEKKELASRDVVSRRMETHIRKGKGAQSRFGEHLWLDITQLGRAPHREEPARGQGDLRAFLGIDPVEKMIAVRPAQHYTMGGVRTDHTGQSPTLKGLFAAGEAACWDMHGFNRLGGNSVAETVVAGMIVGDFVADFCDDDANDVRIPTGLVREFVGAEQAKLDRLVSGAAGDEDASAIKAAMQDVMTAKVGIFRTGAELASAVDELQALLERSRQHRPAPQGGRRQPRARDRVPGAEDAQARALRRPRRRATDRKPGRALPRGLPASRRRAVAEAHARELERRRRHAADARLRAARRRSMELPPGWRGYGAKDYVDHPDTAARTAEVLALRERLKEAPRFEVQHSLMPYDELLPQRAPRAQRAHRRALGP